KPHTQHRCFSCLNDAWRAKFGDEVERPHWAELLSAEGDCYLCVPLDPGIEAAALGASESSLPGTAPAEALHTFTLDSSASRCFFRDSTTLTPLPALDRVRLTDPSRGPVVARSSTVLPCPAVPSGSLSGLHLPSFSTNLVSTAALQDTMVTTTTLGGQCVSICTCTRTGRHLATFTRRPESSLYTLATEPSQVAASAQVSASGPVAPPCSCRLLSHQNLLWHHRLDHPFLPHLCDMQSRLLVSGLPRSLPPLPPSHAPHCLPCIEGQQRAALHSSFPPMTAPLHTLHMDVWGPARVSGQGRGRYFLLVVDDYTRYITVFPLRSKGQVVDVLIPRIRAVCLQLRERFCQDLPILRLHSDRGGEFSSDLVRDFCRGKCILQTFTLPDSPQKNGIAERCIGLVMEVAHTSMIHAAAPHFLWLFAVRYAAHQLNHWPRVSLPKTSPTLRWMAKVGDPSVFGSRVLMPWFAIRPRTSSPPVLFPASSWAFPLTRLADSFITPPRAVSSPLMTSCLTSRFFIIVSSPSALPLPHPHRSSLLLVPLRKTPSPPKGPALSGVSQVDPLPGTVPDEVAGDSGAARGGASGGAEPGGAEPGDAEPGGAEPGGAEPGGAESDGASSRGAELGGAEPGGAEPAGVEPGGAEPEGVELGGVDPEGVEPGGAESECAKSGGAEPRGAALPRGLAGASPSLSPQLETLSLQQLREWLVRHARLRRGATRAGGTGDAGAEDAGVTASAAGAGGAGAGGARARGARAGGAGAGVGASPLPAPSPYTEQTGSLTERREPVFRPASPVRTGRRVPHLRPPRVLGRHAMSLRPSSVPLRVPLPPPLESTLPAVHDPESDCARASSPTISRLLATVVTEPSFESTAASALVAELLEFLQHSRVEIRSCDNFAVTCRLDYATPFVAESVSASPPSVGGECALGMDVYEDMQEDFEYLSAVLRRPPGFTGSFPAGTKWSLWRPVHGLREVPRQWHNTLRTTLVALGFSPTADPSVFLRTDTSLPPFYVLVYVDDLVFATADTEALTLVKSELHNRHPCTDLVHQVFQRFGFEFCSPQPTLMSTSHSLSAPSSDMSVEPSGPYPELVGCLMFLMTCTRPDLAYPLSLLARYVAPGRHRKGYTFSLGSGSVSWRSTRSSSVLSSSCEAEIYAEAMAAQELRWLTYLLTDFGE
ncbi:unnamed protein product, partial [Closterium sp. NIES-53]